MNTFQKLFSLDPSQIKQDVIITPFLNLDLFRQDTKDNIKKGLLFEVLNEDKFSVIKSGMGISFVADAVLYLSQTPCRRVYFLGSCGSVSGLSIGQIIVAQKAYAFESFTQTANNKFPAEAFLPDKKLLDSFLKVNKYICKKATLATVCSLYLEEKEVFPFKKRKVDVVDLETSSFYSASCYVGLPALAILYVTDIVNKKPFYRSVTPQETSLIKDSRTQAISMLCSYIKERSV